MAESAKTPPVTLFYGDEDYLIEQEVARIRSAHVDPAFESLNYQVFEAPGFDIGTAISACETLPAFSQTRVVVIKGAGSLRADQQKKLTAYVEDPSPTTVLVLTAPGKINRTTAFFKALKKRAVVKPFYRKKEGELVRWVVDEARAMGKKIAPATARRLVALAGTSLRDLKGELEKIVLYAGEREAIEDSDVSGVGLDCREDTVFDLSEAIGAKDLAGALRIYSKVAGEPPVQVLGAISRQMRMLLKTKALVRRGVPAKGLASKLRVPPFAVEGYVKRSRRFTEAELRGVMKRLAAADRTLKSGGAPRDSVLPGLITELCVPGR